LTDSLPRFDAFTLADVPHGFFGRFAVDDGSEDAMACYRQAVVADLASAGSLVMLRQTHSADCIVVREPWLYADRPEGDALVTDRADVVLGIVTADCAPVLLADPAAGVVGAAHAGWRGARAGVLENTVAAMERLGARSGRIVAAIGPTIAQGHYEVDDAFRASFTEADAQFFAPGRTGRYQFNLPAFVAQRLHDAGVASVKDLAHDTYADQQRLHSFRRAVQQGVQTAGRQISAIACG
jgi:YfiH family protein